MKKVLVAGGSGYVGSRVALALAGRGVPVIAVDIIPPRERGVVFPRGVELRQADLRVPAAAAAALKGADIVLHLAADIGSLTHMHGNPGEHLTYNCAHDAGGI